MSPSPLPAKHSKRSIHNTTADAGRHTSRSFALIVGPCVSAEGCGCMNGPDDLNQSKFGNNGGAYNSTRKYTRKETEIEKRQRQLCAGNRCTWRVNLM
eukprot:5089178-Pyramimonas_sp.AAC.1